MSPRPLARDGLRLGPALAAVVVAIACGILAVPAEVVESADQEVLIGWQGETYRGTVDSASQASSDAGERTQAPWIETISWQPRAFVHHGFLTNEECDHLIKISQNRLQRSEVVSEGKDGKDGSIDDVRTSFSAGLAFGEDEVVAAIEQRISQWTHLPVSHGEAIEVLRYTNGQKYDAHWDYFDKVDKTGNRVATVLIYLSDVEDEAGGETAMPLAELIDASLQTTKGMSECATKMGMAIRPHKGDALLFWDLHPDGKTPDRHALHASCPTFKGHKYTATCWIHALPYRD